MKKNANYFAQFHYAQKRCVSWLMKLCIVAILFSPVLVKASQTPNFGNIEQNQITIKGVVTSADDGLSIPGVSVVVKGTSNGTSTDFDGNFTIQAEEGQTLVFSFVGMTTQEVVIKGNSLNIILESENLGLDEVVVVGYGTQKKSDITGAVSSVKGEDLKKTPSSNAVNALQGKVAGVTITKFGGAPGSGSSITIRGIGTVGNNEPLYIIDGLPGSMSLLNPDDIESFEILKDGASAAIYGSRAANGVVLITTKKGKKGQVNVDFNMHLGQTKAIDQLNLLDSEGYIKVHKMMYDNYNQYAADGDKQALPDYITAPITANTNWQEEVSRAALQQNYNLSINGGNDLGYYGVSGSWNDEEGTLIGSDYLKKTLRAKLGMTKGRLSVDANISYAETNSEETKFSLSDTYKLTPLISPFDENGNVQLTSGDMPANANPYANHLNTKGETDLQYFSANITGRLNFTDWLSYQVNLGLINSNNNKWNYHTKFERSPKDGEDYIYYGEERNNYRSQIMEHLLNFQKDFGKHSVSSVIGYTASKETNNWMGANVTGKNTVYSAEGDDIITKDEMAGFLDPSWMTLDAGKGGTYAAYGSRNEYTRTSILGRVNYSFDSKYLLQVTARRDGSSKFGSDSRYGTFPSVALGWRITQEDFMSDYEFIDNLKLRASWGKLGNEVTLGFYDHQALIRTGNDSELGAVRGSGANPWTGSIATGLENRELQWETTISKNLGLDFTLLGNKFNGTINFYNTTTEDMLIYRQLPGSAGLDSPVLNVGEINNKGFEFELGYYKQDGDFKYSINTTFTTTKNEVVSLASKDQALFGEGLKYGDSHFPTQTKAGYEIGAFFLYQTDGLFQSMDEVNAHSNKDGDLLQASAKPGDIRFKDTNGDGELNEKDKVYSGSGIPDFTYSINFNASYKGFDFSMMFYGVEGNELYNGNRYYLENMSAGQNFLASSLNAWTETNKNTNTPRAVLGDANTNTRESDRYLEDGSFLRLKNIELGYTLPKSMIKRMGVSKCRVYFNAQNVFTITDYSGIDPEVGRSNVLNTGIDRSLYPINKSFFAGVQLSF
ncbi:TonB-dependent receptor [Ancylomarina euxinus]|uniref:TonB-dependent receptor n=1 Tax=Ancylomarina euxinus TaxID=2283627 RepID=A0A425XX43_9BACT|nr:TonB-dependent receptor [Ancylomarina euxinus]MCZ4696205.1 TonB-dependent receptor [Ancylomarina euxinus]MUP16431.1 SusC/RagA family TonB-linked outer membrane protein [Ancylomarina euxinus]RRG19221.1 TonB-dependent receptor [Ancylomarina euxinus]